MRKRFCDGFKIITPQTLFDRITPASKMETSNRPKPPRRSQSEAASVSLMVAVKFTRVTLRAPSFSRGAELREVFRNRRFLNVFFRLFL